MPQDGHIQIHHRGARVDIRVGTMPTIYGESLVMRLLEKNSRLLTVRGTGPGSASARLCSRGWWKTARPFSRHRPDRQRQDHDALFHPARHLHAGEENPHHRRPGGIRAARRGANPRAAQPQFHLCHRPALDPAPGPGRGDGRRNPRFGNGRNRHPRRADRPPGFQHAAHERFHRRGDAADGHGRGGVSDFVLAGRRAGATAGAADLPALPDAKPGGAGDARPARSHRRPENRGRFLPGQGL